MHAAIADTGALVALLDRAERHHGWAAQCIREMEVPLLICEPVLTEAMHLLAHLPRAQDELFGLLENGALKISFCVEDHVPALRALHRKYQDKPISLADACIVRMAELHDKHAVFTLDSDFFVYRKHGRQALSLICPIAAPPR
jgi:predicted nucleic acid-binding protein